MLGRGGDCQGRSLDHPAKKMPQKYEIFQTFRFGMLQWLSILELSTLIRIMSCITQHPILQIDAIRGIHRVWHSNLKDTNARTHTSLGEHPAITELHRKTNLLPESGRFARLHVGPVHADNFVARFQGSVLGRRRVVENLDKKDEIWICFYVGGDMYLKDIFWEEDRNPQYNPQRYACCNVLP
jgi:hypothetical protein